MDTQLRLLPGHGPEQGRSPDWHLDEDTRRVGLRGVALAREALRAAHRPRPEIAADEHEATSRRHDPAA